MFGNTLDSKNTITDTNGIEIVDLVKSIFGAEVVPLSAYNTVKMEEKYLMRPDKVSFIAYGTDNYAEMILKYSGISNPFSLCKDDIILIPPEAEMNALLAANLADDTNAKEAAAKINIKNFYKFKSDYKSNPSAYDEYEQLEIKSGADEELTEDYYVPYISDDGTAAITIRNGRMYFGEDCGLSVSIDLDKKIQTLIDCTATAIADQCAINGLSLTDFVSATTKNS